MNFDVTLTPKAIQNIHAIPPRIVPAIIEFIYGDLARFPLRVGKPLRREHEGSYSARRGTYRILYEVDAEERKISVFRVDHRAHVYERSSSRIC